MIAHLRGRILEKQPTRVIVEAGGVGYDVAVPLSTFYGLGEPGAEVALRVHTHVREDALALYGFATALELDLFDRLISISGIGPKLALAVLSGIEPPDLVGAIERGDLARLTAIPGVSLFSIALVSQTLNAMILPLVFYYLIKLASSKNLMGDNANSVFQKNFTAIASVVIVIVTTP